jgi:hypothetical protein
MHFTPHHFDECERAVMKFDCADSFANLSLTVLVIIRIVVNAVVHIFIIYFNILLVRAQLLPISETTGGPTL